jgi:hypothetical protein
MRGPVSRCGGALWGLRAMVEVLQMVVSARKIVARRASFNLIRKRAWGNLTAGELLLWLWSLRGRGFPSC